MAAKKPKKPRKPKASASITAWVNFDNRVKAWKSKCSAIDNAKKRKAAIQKKYANGIK